MATEVGSALLQKAGPKDMMAAELLLSVSPMFKPQQPRDRSWSLQSLETLVDVATRGPGTFSLGPSATGGNAAVDRRMKQSKKVVVAPGTVKGRSLLQNSQPVTNVKRNGLPLCTCGKVGCGTLMAKQRKAASEGVVLKTRVLNRPGSATTHTVTKSANGGKIVTMRVVRTVKSASSGSDESVGSSSSVRRVVIKRPVSPVQITCPSILPPKYKLVYNRDGRVGIYDKQQRKRLIDRFVSKRNNRVWSKTVRYSCRKNLAKQRVRVKGRFVKTTEPLKVQPDDGVTNE